MNLQHISLLISASGLLVTILNLLFTKFFPWAAQEFKKNKLSSKLDKNLFAQDYITESLKYYIKPYCQPINPVGTDETKQSREGTKCLFKEIDRLLSTPCRNKYIIILADAGMGKSSFLLNYYAKHLLKIYSKFRIELCSLNLSDIDNKIKGIINKENTVLFLDALDEDILAITDLKSRINDLNKLTVDFYKVVISCRTQFIQDPNDIKFNLKNKIVGPEPLCNDSPDTTAIKLYISFLTFSQINCFIRRRYFFWQFKIRKKVKKTIKRIHNIAIRPMILRYIDDLINIENDFKYSIQIYEAIVQAWLRREEAKDLGVNIKGLREFSDNLAVDIYLNKDKRMADRITFEEIKGLSSKWGIKIEDWEMKGRSLIELF